MRETIKKIVLCGVLLISVSLWAQEKEAVSSKAKALEKNSEAIKNNLDPALVIKAQNLTYQGNESIANNEFIAAETAYRTAIGTNPEDARPAYNLGSALYDKEAYKEALTPLKKAVIAAKDKSEKHTALHNLGNAFMKNKNYEKAVETYKEALRNVPTDDQTRYNLALAKKMLEKEKQEQDQNKDNKDQQNQDQKDQDQKDQEDKENKGEQDQEGDQKKDPNADPQDGDGNKKDSDSDAKDPSEEEKEEQKKGEGDTKKETPQKPKEAPEKPKERKSQLSPQQIKNLLEAMQNAEKKSQEKLEGKKVKGTPVKNKKDW